MADLDLTRGGGTIARLRGASVGTQVRVKKGTGRDRESHCGAPLDMGARDGAKASNVV